jgi:hypothetical protein
VQVYDIVNRESLPKELFAGKHTRKGGKWVNILDKLSPDEVIVMSLNTLAEAQITQTMVLACARPGRREYTIHTRKVCDGGRVVLYVWKGGEHEA